jgi:ferredoxin
MNSKLPTDHVLTRGTVIIDVEACKGCDLCIDACKPGVLTIGATAFPSSQPGAPPVVRVRRSVQTSCSRCGSLTSRSNWNEARWRPPDPGSRNEYDARTDGGF